MTLPLFPLATVLFPGGLLPLRVFEQRYIQLVSSCLRDARPFGVCLIVDGSEVMAADGAPPAFEAIGTLAHITDVDMPEAGILHVRTRGGTRFRVLEHRVLQGGLVEAQVRVLDDEPAPPLPADAAPLARLVELMANRVGARDFPAPLQLDDASWVGYRLAEALPLPPRIRQRMLEVNDALLRLQLLRRFLREQGVVT